jgi:MoxR-like ATPase
MAAMADTRAGISREQAQSDLREAHPKAQAIEENISQVIVGKPVAVRLAMVPLLCRGHLLLEDVPGVGKTTLAKALARSIDGQFRRLQFTPDLLPLDVTGSTVYNQRTQEFEFRQGPVFTHVLLADEINRATPRTQSALLECMEESQVSVDGRTHRLPDIFFTIATENPIESAGTFPLPETQLDRFLLRIHLGYPTEEEELEIFDRQAQGNPLDALRPAAGLDDVAFLRSCVPRIHVERSVKEYMAKIVRATREHPDARLGASPRGTLSLVRASQAYALLSRLPYVTPDVVKAVAGPVLGHRIIVKPHAQIRGTSGQDVVRSVLDQVQVPVKAVGLP